MLKITTVPAVNLIEVSIDPKGLYPLQSLAVTVFETDTQLTERKVQGFIDWGNGQLPQTLAGSYIGGTPSGISTPTIFQGILYSPGFYQIHIHASNFRFPVGDIADEIINLHVNRKSVVENKPQGVVFGPILPRDSGSPNSNQWNLDTASDLGIIASSVKMLLITGIGDRIMLPDYGTNLRALIFESDSNTVELLAREDINTALSYWEPRASLQALKITRNGRVATIDAIFVSNIHQTQFPVNLQLTP